MLKQFCKRWINRVKNFLAYIHFILDKTKPSPTFSLPSRMIAIVIICWIMPITIFSSVTVYFITNNMDQQINRTIASAVNYSIFNTLEHLNSLIQSSRYASYNSSIKDANLLRQQISDHPKEKEELSLQVYDKIINFMSEKYKYDNQLLLTTLYFNNDPDQIYYVTNEKYNVRYFDVRWYQNNIHPQIQTLADSLESKIGFLNIDDQVYMVRNILDTSFKSYAVLVMQLNTDHIFSSLKNITWDNESVIWLENIPIVVHIQEDSSINLKALLEESEEKRFFKKETYTEINSTPKKDKYIFSGKNLDAGVDFSYFIVVNSSQLIQEFTSFKSMLFILVLLVLPLLLTVIWFFARNISRPIKRLIRAAQEIEKGVFGETISEQFHSSEFDYLADAFNSMSFQLQHQFERIYKEELALRDARIIALQSQINPHFLNNTLEIINWEARISKNVKVSRMIESLSIMMDAAMDRTGSHEVPLSDEMSYVDAYLYIISERFGEKIKINKEIDPDVLGFLVPRLIMQPVIENAIEHGLSSLDINELDIKIYRDDNFLIIQIENDGFISEMELEKIHQLLLDRSHDTNSNFSNLGIKNVNQRLKILYGEESGLFIKNSRKNKVLATINILIKKNDMIV